MNGKHRTFLRLGVAALLGIFIAAAIPARHGHLISALTAAALRIPFDGIQSSSGTALVFPSGEVKKQENNTDAPRIQRFADSTLGSCETNYSCS